MSPPLDLDAIAALDAARTPGTYHGFPTGILSGSTWVVSNAPDEQGAIMTRADAAAIITAVNAIGPLLARVRAAEARVAELEAVIEDRDNIAWERGERD